MPRLRRRLVPGVVPAVLILDRPGRELFRRRAIQAGDVDGIEDAAQRLHVAAAKWLVAAVPTEQVVDGTAAELVIRKDVTTHQQAERFVPHNGLPESSLGADRAVAPARAFGRIDV